MTSLPTRRASPLLALGLATLVAGCADGGTTITAPVSATAVENLAAADVRLAVKAQDRHAAALMRTPGVVGTAVGRLPNGRVGIRVFVALAATRDIPPRSTAYPSPPK